MPLTWPQVDQTAPITVTGSTLEPGAPVVLLSTRIFGGGVDVQQGRQYDVARDGRLLIKTELDSADASITVLMGEVYRATDTNLSRQVAINVLPAAFAQDPDRLARFEREARTLANAQSPEHRGDLRPRRRSG